MIKVEKPSYLAWESEKLRVLFLVEGFTDVRFVLGLSEISHLTLAVPRRQFRESGLRQRLAETSAELKVVEIPGGRVAFQLRSFAYLLRNARGFDVIVSQEVLRGSLNATIAGWLLGVPTITYMGISPIEYFRCRRERGQIGLVAAVAGEWLIRCLMTINGMLATRCLAMGPYLRDVALKYCARSETGGYYGVDTTRFCPADSEEKIELRRKHDLPLSKFIIFFSSRISHEKDPETVLRATALARAQGLDAILLNLGGGYKDFITLAHARGYLNPDEWVIGRPALNPLGDLPDIFRTADVVVLSSLAEGAAFSTLESLACATPVVATDIGGMSVQLRGYARLTPRRDAESMAREILWVAAHPEDARKQSEKGRDFIRREWEVQKIFRHLRAILKQTAKGRSGESGRSIELRQESTVREKVAVGLLNSLQTLGLQKLAYSKPLRAIGKQILMRRTAEASTRVIASGLGKGLRMRVLSETPQSYWMGSHEPQMQAAIRNNVRVGMTVYDCGANIGFYCAIFARLVGRSGTVFAFEPSRASLEALRCLKGLNGFTNLEIVDRAIWSSTGTVNFTRGEGNRSLASDHVSGVFSDVTDLQNTEVGTVSLDDFVFLERHRAPQLIKLDVEGSEGKALSGAERTLREHRPVLLLEIHGAPGVEVWAILQRLRYRIVNIVTGKTPEKVEDFAVWISQYVAVPE